MKKTQWVVYFESANYAGRGHHAIVWAESKHLAMSNESLLAYMEDFYYVQESDRFIDEYGAKAVKSARWSTIVRVIPYEGSEFVELVASSDPDMYPIFGSKD